MPTRSESELSLASFPIGDTTTGLETALRDQYLDVPNQVKRQLRESDGVGVFHRIGQRSPPPRRLTPYRADTVRQVAVQSLSRELETRSIVTNARFGHTLDESIPLLSTDRVRLDTSRSIA